jgi:hypothetical protein
MSLPFRTCRSWLIWEVLPKNAKYWDFDTVPNKQEIGVAEPIDDVIFGLGRLVADA